MKNLNDQKILMIANTPFELYYLSSVACLLKEKNPKLKIKLWIRKSHREAVTPELASLYSKIEAIDFPTLTFPLSKNPALLFKSFLKNLFQTLKFRKFLKDYPWDIELICVSSFREFFSNMLCKYRPKNIKLIAFRMANQGIEKLRIFQKRPILSFFLNLKNFFFGYSLMNYKFRTDVPEAAEKSFKKNPYFRTVSITDHHFKKENKNWRLPPPFPALRKLYSQFKKEAPGILVAGERVPLYDSWSEKDDKTYQEFLDYLKENFKEYRLYFKPRKGLTDISRFDLHGFEILNPEIPLEEFCLRKNLCKIIAIKSTSAKVGAYFGIPSYLIYPRFNLPQDFRTIFEKYFEDMKSIVRVKNWSEFNKAPEFPNHSIEDLVNLYWNVVFYD